MGASNDSADSQRVIDYAARSALTRCGADRCSIVLQGRGANYRAHAGPEGPADGLDDALKECRTAQRPVRRKDRKTGRQVLALPFKVAGAFSGALAMERGTEPFSADHAEHAGFTVEFLTTALENIFLRSRILTDQLTGLCNSDYFKSVVGRELDYARQLKRSLALVLLDVDNFNHANQTLGRRAADEILVRAADRIGRTLSADSGITAHRLDLWLESHIGRFGGDEFAFLLFDVTRDEARRLTDQILAAIREDEFDFEGRKIKYTATAGVAMYPSDAADLNKLFIKSYHALYTAKVNGKDRCGTLGPANDSIPPPIDSGELGRSSRGKALSAAIGNVASHAGSRIEALVHAILRDMLKAVPAQRARIVLFDDQDKPRYSAAEGAWGDGTISRTRLLSSAHIRALLENEGHSAGIVELERREGVFTPEDHALINAFAARLGPEIDRSRRLQEATSRLRELEEQVRHGLRELQHRYTFGKIIGRSKTMQDLFLLLEKVAAVDYPVIIEGETGVGKELVAKAIHFNSRRRDRPFIPVNCAAVSETLLESELFGHEKGAFTGADKYKPGLFELSAGGTLFIDEIEEMSEAMQKKLLRVLEEEQMRPVGGKQFVPVDVRVIASTNTDTEKLLNQEKLREDLYYRLSTFVLSVPALRDRAEDVPLIAEALIGEIAGELAGPSKKLTPSAMNVLMGYSWPGNVRELRNELRKAYVMCEGDDIEERNLSVHLRAGPSRRRASGSFERAMQDFERSMILDAMEMYDWNISRGAEALGMARNTLKAKLKAYNLRKP